MKVVTYPTSRTFTSYTLIKLLLLVEPPALEVLVMLLSPTGLLLPLVEVELRLLLELELSLVSPALLKPQELFLSLLEVLVSDSLKLLALKFTIILILSLSLSYSFNISSILSY